MFTVFVTRIENNRVRGATTHEYKTLLEAAMFAAKIPADFHVAIVDSDLNIVLPEMPAGELTRENVLSFINPNPAGVR